MGQKNAVTRRFYSNKTRFADLVNGIYFQGRKIINPEDLSESSEVYAVPQIDDFTGKNRDYFERTRDIKMRHHSGASIRILAIENQHYVDYSMPLRNMQYDVLEYQQQLEEIKHRNKTADSFTSANELLCKIKKTDRLWPVHTLCLYLGEEPWDGPRSLKDMMDFGEDTEGMSKHFADYPFRLYCVNEEQDFSMFHTDVRNIFELLPLRKNKRKLLEKLESSTAYNHMTEDSLELLSVLMDSPGIWKNRKKYLNPQNTYHKNETPETEEYNMCQAIRELVEDGRQEGRLEGRLETLKQNVENLMGSLSISLEKACELLGRTEDYEMLRQMLQK